MSSSYQDDIKHQFYTTLESDSNFKTNNSKTKTREEIKNCIDLINKYPSMSAKERSKTKGLYSLKNNYRVQDSGSGKRLIHNKSGKIVVAIEDAYDMIHSVHTSKSHVGVGRTYTHLRDLYHNITQEHVNLFVKLCPVCASVKSKFNVKVKGEKKQF